MNDTDPIRIFGISGSLRRGSFNTALLEAAAELAPPGVEVAVATLHGIPGFNPDLETESGPPAPVAALRRCLEAAHGLLIATPEYNFSVTGVLKNGIDWLSRSPSPLDAKPTALMSSAGGSGGSHALRHLREILSHNRVHVSGPAEVRVRRGSQHFTEGRLVTPETRAEVAALIADLAALIRHDEGPADVVGSVLIVAADSESGIGIANGLAERGIRSLVALTRQDTMQFASSRRIAGAVLDPELAAHDADLIQKDLEGPHPDIIVLRPTDRALAVPAVLEALVPPGR